MDGAAAAEDQAGIVRSCTPAALPPRLSPRRYAATRTAQPRSALRPRPNGGSGTARGTRE